MGWTCMHWTCRGKLVKKEGEAHLTNDFFLFLNKWFWSLWTMLHARFVWDVIGLVSSLHQHVAMNQTPWRNMAAADSLNDNFKPSVLFCGGVQRLIVSFVLLQQLLSVCNLHANDTQDLHKFGNRHCWKPTGWHACIFPRKQVWQSWDSSRSGLLLPRWLALRNWITHETTRKSMLCFLQCLLVSHLPVVGNKWHHPLRHGCRSWLCLVLVELLLASTQENAEHLHALRTTRGTWY